MILKMKDIPDPTIPVSFALILALFYTLCGWYRLVRFASKPTGIQFLGLPVPAAAMMVGSALVVALDVEFAWLMPPELLVVVCVGCGVLMVTQIPYPSPKRGMTWDVVLIVVAQLSVAWYVIFADSLAVVSVFACSLLYVIAGPTYLIVYGNRDASDTQHVVNTAKIASKVDEPLTPR